MSSTQAKPITLIQFPTEVLLRILHGLSSKHLLRLSQTCKTLNTMVSDDSVWRKRCKGLPRPKNLPSSFSFKKLYAQNARSLTFPRPPAQSGPCRPPRYIPMPPTTFRNGIENASLMVWFRVPPQIEGTADDSCGGILVGAQSSRSHAAWPHYHLQPLHITHDGYIHGSYDHSLLRRLSGPFVATGRWHCAVITVEGLRSSSSSSSREFTQRLYVDGMLVDSETGIRRSWAPELDYCTYIQIGMGCISGGREGDLCPFGWWGLRGAVRDVRAWQRALSGKEVGELWGGSYGKEDEVYRLTDDKILPLIPEGYLGWSCVGLPGEECLEPLPEFELSETDMVNGGEEEYDYYYSESDDNTDTDDDTESDW